MALKHHDEVAKTRSVDKFSDDMRVLARREAVSDREAGSSSAGRRRPRSPRRSPAVRHAARRQAAPARSPQARRLRSPRRGRAPRVTSSPCSSCADVVVGAGVPLGWFLAWAPVIPVGITLLFLVVARVAVRRERSAGPARPPRSVAWSLLGRSSLSSPGRRSSVRARHRGSPPLCATTRASPSSAVSTTPRRSRSDWSPSWAHDGRRGALGPAAGDAADVRHEAARHRSVRTIDLGRVGGLELRSRRRGQCSRGRCRDLASPTQTRVAGPSAPDSEGRRPGGIFCPRSAAADHPGLWRSW